MFKPLFHIWFFFCGLRNNWNWKNNKIYKESEQILETFKIYSIPRSASICGLYFLAFWFNLILILIWHFDLILISDLSGFPYKGEGGGGGGGSTTFFPFSLSWYWRLFDADWNRKLFCSNKSSITGVKIMASQQTWPPKFYFLSIQFSVSIEMTSHFFS